MNIEVFQTMQWARLLWEQSFQEVIELNNVLPIIGNTYPVEFERNEDHAKEGKAYILWLPPHSELNGWYDLRPSEILKSYVLQGELKGEREPGVKFDFEVQNRMRLVDLFNTIDTTEKSPLTGIGQPDGSSVLHWSNAGNVCKAKVGDYWYLSGGVGETSLEVILSEQEQGICLHYSATLHTPAWYETVVTQYYLNKQEQKMFSRLIENASNIPPETDSEIDDKHIYGALYL